MFNRRSFLKSLAAAPAATLLRPSRALAALPKMKITRVRAYAPPNPNPLFNQADTVVTIEPMPGLPESAKVVFRIRCASARVV
ncbi:MAG TPA: twin-arginine translocation signal domain-containing protein [Bryobacteraceae bacterium]|nr:twin-arginine translocation signal domain-containing protein [Bryobacteraceae bacterium]